MNDEEVDYAVTGTVGVITLQRPAARNALTWTMYARLEELVRTMFRETIDVALWPGILGSQGLSAGES